MQSRKIVKLQNTRLMECYAVFKNMDISNVGRCVVLSEQQTPLH